MNLNFFNTESMEFFFFYAMLLSKFKQIQKYYAAYLKGEKKTAEISSL